MKLKDLLAGEKRKIMVVSEGGTGKSAVIFDTFLFFLRHFERYKKVPVYIPLNDLEDIKNPVYSYIGIRYLNTCSRTAIDGFLSGSRSEYLILCDGYNEISDDSVKASAREDIIRLSKHSNVSTVISSRYDNSGFIDFERYVLKELDEELLRRRVPNYPELDENLRELLHTPFNLTLYLGLSAESRGTKIDSAADLIRLNIAQIPGVPSEPETDREKQLHFMFRFAFPMLAYTLARKNLLVFDKKQLEEMMDEACGCIKEDYFYEDLLPSLRSDASKLAFKFCELLKRNSIIFQPDKHRGRFIIIHENYRDYFASCGYLIVVEHFFELTDRKRYPYRFFLPPIRLDPMLSDVIRYIEDTTLADKTEGEGVYRHPQTYFDDLFNKTSRNLLHDDEAARFNKTVIDLMKQLRMDFTFGWENYNFVSKNKPITLYENFRHLDLSLVNFCSCMLLNCDFTGSVMNENAFRSMIPHNMPDEVYTDNERVYLRYPTQYPSYTCDDPGDNRYWPYRVLRCVNIHSGYSYELKTRGDPFCIYNGKIYSFDISEMFNTLSLFITVINAENGSFSNRVRIDLPDCFRYANALLSPIVLRRSDSGAVCLGVLFVRYLLTLDIDRLEIIGYTAVADDPFTSLRTSVLGLHDRDFRSGNPIAAYCNNKDYTDRALFYSYRRKKPETGAEIEFREVQFDPKSAECRFIKTEENLSLPPGAKLLHIQMNGGRATAVFQRDDELRFLPLFEEAPAAYGGIAAAAAVPCDGSENCYRIVCKTMKGNEISFQAYGKQLLLNCCDRLLSIVADGVLTVRQLCTAPDGGERFKIILTVPLASTRYRLWYKGISDTAEIRHAKGVRDYRTDIHRFVLPGKPVEASHCRKAMDAAYGKKYLVAKTAPFEIEEGCTVIGNYRDASGAAEYVVFLRDRSLYQRVKKSLEEERYQIAYACCVRGRWIVAFYRGWWTLKAAVLDLETDEVKILGIFCEADEIVYVPSGGEETIFLLKSGRDLLEMHIDLETLKRRIVHRSEFLPDVDLMNCRFDNVTLVSPDIDMRSDWFLDNEIDEIFSVWEENNLHPGGSAE